MKPTRRALATASAVALVLAGCGSSSSSSTPTTSSTSQSATSSAGAANKTAKLPGTTGTKRLTLATLSHASVQKRFHGRLTGLEGLSLTQKLITLATSVSSFWSPLFQNSQAQLPAATINIIDQSPVTCGNNTITSSGTPQYCFSDASLDLPVSTIQSNIAPIGDAAVALMISDLYGFHIERALGVLNSSSLTAADLLKLDSCFSGLYFFSIQGHLTAADGTAVGKLIAATAPPGGSPNSVTAADLLTWFTKGFHGSGKMSACVTGSGTATGQ
jgi:predicted metalloprotease